MNKYSKARLIAGLGIFIGALGLAGLAGKLVGPQAVQWLANNDPITNPTGLFNSFLILVILPPFLFILLVLSLRLGSKLVNWILKEKEASNV